MTRLRVRIELNQRLAGVPLEKMASVVEETRKFFYLLSEDVQIEADRGEWLASDFDTESLNFTAEYAGPVSAEQVHAFGAAFAGATSLRRTTIAQFTRIADFLGEDELVGFGLYQSDQENEPSEWRCLSKRDALRFGEEIKLLAQASGEQPQGTQLPAVMNGSISGRRLFKDRREREALAADPARSIRELESSLTRRIALLEDEVAAQSRRAQISGNPDVADEKFQRLLSAMEAFWAQAPRQLPQLPAQATAPAANSMPPPIAMEVKAPRQWSVLGLTIAATIAILAGLAFPEVQRQWVRFARVEILPTSKPKPPAAPVLPIPTPTPRPQAESPESQESHEPGFSPEVQSASMSPVAARSSEPFIGPLIPLDIPASVKSKIQSEVRVDVIVAIDEEGVVTGARVASTKGDSAPLLVTEALRAARQSRFRPARAGDRSVESQMILTFLFKPETNEF